MVQAILESSKSNDPSSKLGAVVVGSRGVIVGRGYNGFPPGIAEDERIANRETKYDLVIHSEMRALIQAGEFANGGTLYVTTHPCVRCTVHIIEYGIKRIVMMAPSSDFMSRWSESVRKARALFEEAGIECIQIAGA
jgi:dCMP deaminase